MGSGIGFRIRILVQGFKFDGGLGLFKRFFEVFLLGGGWGDTEF